MSSPHVNSPKPRWWQLYALFPLLVVLFVGEHQLLLSTREHEGVQVAILVVIFGLIYGWLRANTVALIQMDREQRGRGYTVTEYPPASPTQGIAGGNAFHLPGSGLRDTLEDTFELESVNRTPTDFSLN